MAAGVYDAGLETLRADSFTILARQTIHTHAETGADTELLTIRERRRSEPVTLSQALALGRERESGLVRNTQSGRVAVRVPAPGLVTEDGEFEWRVRLVRPMDTQIDHAAEYAGRVRGKSRQPYVRGAGCSDAGPRGA